MKRIGIFVCHCGTNIAGSVDVERVVEEIAKFPEVVYAVDYKYMCSDPGQALIRDHIRQDNLGGVIVAACSPTMHETTFRKTAEAAGLNPYRLRAPTSASNHPGSTSRTKRQRPKKPSRRSTPLSPKFTTTSR